MAKATRAQMRQEALRLLRQLEMGEEICRDWEQRGLPWLSHGADGAARPFGEEETEVIRRVEEEYDGEILVCHVIRCRVFGIPMLTMLTVPQETEAWEDHLIPLGEGRFLTCAYVDSEMESGIGSVVIATAGGPGVVRAG